MRWGARPRQKALLVRHIQDYEKNGGSIRSAPTLNSLIHCLPGGLWGPRRPWFAECSVELSADFISCEQPLQQIGYSPDNQSQTLTVAMFCLWDMILFRLKKVDNF